MPILTARRQPMTTVIIFLAILIGPFLYAQHAFHQANPNTIKTKNYGELIRPPVSLDSIHFTHPGEMTAALNHHWGFVLVNQTGNCDAACEKILYQMMQIHRSLHKHQNRLQRFVWTTTHNLSPLSTLLSKSYVGVTLIALDNFDANLFPADQNNSLVLVDPLGNVMMRYTLDADPSRILKDIKHLLAVSQIG